MKELFKIACLLFVMVIGLGLSGGMKIKDYWAEQWHQMKVEVPSGTTQAEQSISQQDLQNDAAPSDNELVKVFDDSSSLNGPAKDVSKDKSPIMADSRHPGQLESPYPSDAKNKVGLEEKIIEEDIASTHENAGFDDAEVSLPETKDDSSSERERLDRSAFMTGNLTLESETYEDEQSRLGERIMQSLNQIDAHLGRN